MDADNLALAAGFVSAKYINQGSQALSRYSMRTRDGACHWSRVHM